MAKSAWSVIPFLLCSGVAVAQGPPIDTVLYGASYYHEYMPYERLEKDVGLMRQAGISVVRLGESTWSSWEPREGQFEFAWMERILERLHQAGIRAVLGTPTYSIPPWLYRKHPEVLVTRLGGQRAYYGPRQNMDITHPAYRFYAERIIRQVVGRFKDHPAIIGYQVDNETSSYGTAGPSVQAGFVDYLKDKFKTAAELNRLWGFVYWGQLVNDWDELPPRDGILNPGYKLEWERYQQKITTDFLAWQAAIVRQYKRPDQFVTHDFVGGPQTRIDEFEIAKHLDITAVNPYHEVQDELDGEAISLSGDLCRSLKRANYLVTETNAQTIGWDSRTQFPPYDGQLRLNVYSHVASGANMVAYWHWHSLHYGQETYWKGVLSHDLEPNRVYGEVSRIGNELKKAGPRLANLKRANRVALLYSTDSYHGIEFMPFDNRVNYMTVLRQMYRTLYRLNAGVDFVFPQNANFGDYKVIVVPPLYVASDGLLERLAEFVRGGGHLLVAFKSGFTNEHSTVRWTRMPGPLREAAGFSYQEFSNLKQPLALRGDPFGAGEKNRVSVWAEMLTPEKAAVLASYDHPFFGKYALDAIGKKYRLPIWQILGGKYRDEVRIYADCHAGEALESLGTLVNPRTPQWMRKKGEPERQSVISLKHHGWDASKQEQLTRHAYAQRAKEMAARGFGVLKFDIDVPMPFETDEYNRDLSRAEIEHAASLVAAIREAVGPDVGLAIDCHWNYGVQAAVELARALEPYRLLWLEDPVPPENVAALGAVQRNTQTPIATGENHYHRIDFERLITEAGLRVLAPDVQKAGLWEGRKVADLADMHYVNLAPHNISGPLGTMAGVHLCAAIPNFIALEWHAASVPFFDQLVKNSAGPMIRRGKIRVPDAPGLGIELDEDVAYKYRKPGETFFGA